jgi:hypothetical protein
MSEITPLRIPTTSRTAPNGPLKASRLVPCSPQRAEGIRLGTEFPPTSTAATRFLAGLGLIAQTLSALERRA